ncbi:hypothetical protein OAU50_00515 [Planctomycetota bacterium]|nr:hypothetical protein [Planctomycetota bacterium]
MQPEPNNLELYRDDLPALVRGRLSPVREQEIRQAAEADPELARAIGEEQALEGFLDSLKTPEVSADFRQRFWKRFYTTGEATGGVRASWVRLAGPIAAMLVLALGVYIFAFNGDETVPPNPIADGTTEDEPILDTTADEASPAAAAVQEIDFSFATDRPDDKNRTLTLEELELLKALDRAEFVHLDSIDSSEDMALLEDLSLLLEIDAEDGQ